MDKSTKELVENLELMRELAIKNPCGHDRTFFSYLAKSLSGFLLTHFDMSQTQVADYFHVDVRTLRRWQEHRNFPLPHRNGHKELSYNIAEIVKWEDEQKKLNLPND